MGFMAYVLGALREGFLFSCLFIYGVLSHERLVFLYKVIII